MNRVVLMGRLARDPDMRQSQNGEPYARYTLAVDRMRKESGVDFIGCIAFGKNAEFAEKYLNKGTKIAVEGHIQTGSYTNKDGVKVYTTDVIVDRHYFCESRRDSGDQAGYSREQSRPSQEQSGQADSFMDIPEGIDEELPFM